MAGRIQRNRRCRGRGFQRGRRPLWHTTFLGQSSVLYLYEADRIRKSGVARAPRGASATRTTHGNGAHPFDVRSISVFCAIRPESVHRACTSAHSTANVHRSGFAARCAKGFSRGGKPLSKEKVQAM